MRRVARLRAVMRVGRAAALALVLAGGAGACEHHRPSRSARRAAADAALLEGERRLALGERREATHFLFLALDGYRRATDRGGEAASLLALGRLQRREARHALALDFFAKAREISTHTATRLHASVLYGETLIELGRHEAAVGVFGDLLLHRRSGLDRAKLWFHLASAERALGKLRRARLAAEKALALEATPEARALLADLLVDLGEHERAFELSQDVPLAWAQNVLLDRNTRLVAYVLGESRSFLWDVTPSRLRVHVLREKSCLEALAREARLELASGRDGEARGRARLSRALLGSVTLTSDDRRLVVVSSGELASFPFAALSPKDEPVPLVSRLEVVRVASLAGLRELRARARAGGRRYEKWVAVAADPSYGLSGARREARAIAKLGPPGTVAILEGSKATAAVLLGDELGNSRILHLATHGVPGRGVVFSDAIVGSAELERAELSAETVVLSACASGLTDVFLGRGARRVVASHWNVDDEATAELMVEFYARLFSGASPAAALREAQIALRGRPRFSEARYWAAFELHGDWAI